MEKKMHEEREENKRFLSEFAMLIMYLVLSARWVLPNGNLYCRHWLLFNVSDVQIESFPYLIDIKLSL